MKKRFGFRAILLLALVAPVAAQGNAPQGRALSEARRTLEERGRDELHPAENPLVVSGREAEGNDLRSRTPALARSDRAPALLDRGDAYARARALYEEGAEFHAPPKTLSAPEVGPAKLVPEAVPARAPAQVEEPLSPWWRSTLPVFLSAAIVLFFVYRRHARMLRWRT